LRGVTKSPVFAWFTLKSIIQSRKFTGLLKSSLRKEGWMTYWTLTVWDTKEYMMAFRNTGSHLEAMKIARQIADKLDYVHWEDDTIPDWRIAMQRLKETKR
jgi:hypothetical protein